MKKVFAICLATATLTLTAQAHAAPPLDKDIEARLITVCEALKSNKKLRLHQAVEKSSINYRALAKGLQCNGQDGVTFALNHGADDTAMLFAKRGNIDVGHMLAKR